jgi:DNA-binding CsgD family transcriptional regulator
MEHEPSVGSDGPVLHLTGRQKQIVGCVAAGMTESEIAAQLQISPRTVRMHCDVVRARLAVERRRQIPAAYREKTGRDPLELRDRAL